VPNQGEGHWCGRPSGVLQSDRADGPASADGHPGKFGSGHRGKATGVDLQQYWRFTGSHDNVREFRVLEKTNIYKFFLFYLMLKSL